MKLLYELPEVDRLAYEAQMSEGEKIAYCLPSDIEGTEFVKGFMLFTDNAIYRILDGRILMRAPFTELSEFTTEMMYGSVGFYAKRNGSTELLCRFISGRNLPRYSVVLSGCEMLAKRAKGELPTSDEPERYCPKCGRPYLLHTKICPFCRDNKEIYKKLWGMTRGLRLMMLFPLLAPVCLY